MGSDQNSVRYRQNNFVLATRLRPSFAKLVQHTIPNIIPKKGGGAPTGAPSTDRIIGCGRAPLFSLLPACGGGLGGGRARLSALHRGTRQGRRIHHWLSSRTALPETRLDGRYPLLPVSSQPSSSETGRSAGRSATQSRPRCGVTTPARGHRTRSVSRIVSRNALQMSEMADSNLIGDDCQEKSPIWGPAIQPSATAEKPLVSKKNLPGSDEFPAVIARSKATKQSRTAPQRWIASLRSQ